MWSGDGIEAVSEAKSAYATVSLDEDISLTANFAPSSHILQIEVMEGGTVLGAGEYQHGQDASIMATPSIGYEFVSWKGDGISDALVSTTSVKMTKSRYLLAEFRPIFYKVSTSVNSTECGAYSWCR